jgi:ribosomal protein S18 acetylase RimI-like enzyme
MSETSAVYAIQQASECDIHDHLVKCDGNFIPPLSVKVVIKDYAKKLYSNAITFEAWSGDILVGLIAAYFNDTASNTGYITSVSVLKNCMGGGIAGKLMEACIEYAQQHGFNQIRLEVNSASDAAIQLYRKYGFVSYEILNDSSFMSLTVPESSVKL